jgi:hypothetical protein
VTERIALGDKETAVAQPDLFLHRGDAPDGCRSALIKSLNRLRGSDDPVVTFAGLARACVPTFADGCQVELSDGTEPPFRITHPADAADNLPTKAAPVGSYQALLTPFRVVSRTGYPSYAGLVTHWWNDRTPSHSDAEIADLMVKHLIALVDRERLTAAVARAEDRAASLALDAVCGRTIDVATGIVMHQNRLGAEDAEKLLRRSARLTGRDVAQVAASVVRSGGLADSVASPRKSSQVVRDLVLVPADAAARHRRQPQPDVAAARR